LRRCFPYAAAEHGGEAEKQDPSAWSEEQREKRDNPALRGNKGPGDGLLCIMKWCGSEVGGDVVRGLIVATKMMEAHGPTPAAALPTALS
jgi:hypothetical protein